MIQQYSNKELLLVVINIMQCINATFIIYSVNVHIHSFVFTDATAQLFRAITCRYCIYSRRNIRGKQLIIMHHNNSLISLQDIPIMPCAIYVRVDFHVHCHSIIMQAMITGNIGGAVLVVTAVVLNTVCSISPIEGLHSLTI